MLSEIFREKGCDRLFEVMLYVLTSKKSSWRSLFLENLCHHACQLQSILTNSTNLVFPVLLFFPTLKLKGHTAGSPAAPSCGAFWYVMQMQIKTALEGEEKGNGGKKESSSTNIQRAPIQIYVADE